MTALRKQPMTVQDFLAWAEGQPERWELYDGVPVAMAPERLVHGRTKRRVSRAFEDAITAARAACESVLDSVAVPVSASSSYQPDLLVYCGPALPGDTIAIRDPVIVVEVLSPGNAMKDLRDKLQGYFRVASVKHYLIVDPDKRIVIHHARAEGDAITTRIIGSGTIVLDPPGLAVEAGDLFAEPVPE